MTAAVKPSVAEALSLVMGDVQSIGKNQRVDSGPARYNFRGVDDVMLAVGPALRQHGVVFTPSRVVSVEHERYETAKGAPMDGVTVVVEYTITGPAGDSLTAAAAGQAADSGDKAVPKAMSVAYRTVLLQALCIPTGEPDPDSSVHERAARQHSGRDWAAEAHAATSVDAIGNVWRQAVAAGEMDNSLAALITKLNNELKAAEPPKQAALGDDDPWATPAEPTP